jgi:predicted lipoprotein with Yx(FWY)xxD motif
MFVLAIAGCGGGGYGSSPSTTYATAAPSTGPVLQTAVLAGSNGFVSPTGRTVYVLSADFANTSTCTISSGCIGLWPPVFVPSGAKMGSGWSSFPRTDGLGAQLAYNGWPLYMYSGDSAAGQTNGNGIVSFGGTWSIARPGMASAPNPPGGAPAPTSTPGGGGGY